MRRPRPHLAPLLTLVMFWAGACSTSSVTSPAPAGQETAPATPSSTSTSTAPIAPTEPTATPGPSVLLGPAVRLTLDASGPMVASDDGPVGHHWVLPAAAARDRDGGFVLFIVWFGDEAGDQIVTVARSDDGRAWRIGKEPVLTDLGMDVVNPGPIPAALLQLDDGTWRLYGWAAHRTDLNAFTSWTKDAAPA